MCPIVALSAIASMVQLSNEIANGPGEVGDLLLQCADPVSGQYIPLTK